MHFVQSATNTALEVLRVGAIALALAFLAESGTEYLLGIALNRFPQLDGWRWLLPYIALGIGVGFAFHYRVDLIALISTTVTDAWYPPDAVGMICSGFIIGRGANFLHDFWSRFILKKPSV
jgi:hypothetical protein